MHLTTPSLLIPFTTVLLSLQTISTLVAAAQPANPVVFNVLNVAVPASNATPGYYTITLKPTIPAEYFDPPPATCEITLPPTGALNGTMECYETNTADKVDGLVVGIQLPASKDAKVDGLGFTIDNKEP